MYQYLLGHEYWSYVEEPNGATPDSTHMDFPAWEQSANRVLYCFPSSVGDQLLSYIWDAKTPKHNGQETAAPARAQQCPIERFFCGRFDNPDQEHP